MARRRVSTGWWDFSCRALDLLTRPRLDAAAADREVEQLARESLLGRLLHRGSVTVREAWASSLSHDVMGAWSSSADASPVEAYRAAGWTVAVAGVTVLALNAIKPMPPGRLVWLVPAGLAVAGVLLMAAASPVSRAAADRRARSVGRPVQGRRDKVS